MLDRLDKPVDRTRWLMTPQTVNAYCEHAPILFCVKHRALLLVLFEVKDRRLRSVLIDGAVFESLGLRVPLP